MCVYEDGVFIVTVCFEITPDGSPQIVGVTQLLYIRMYHPNFIVGASPGCISIC